MQSRWREWNSERLRTLKFRPIRCSKSERNRWPMPSQTKDKCGFFWRRKKERARNSRKWFSTCSSTLVKCRAQDGWRWQEQGTADIVPKRILYEQVGYTSKEQCILKLNIRWFPVLRGLAFAGWISIGIAFSLQDFGSLSRMACTPLATHLTRFLFTPSKSHTFNIYFYFTSL